MSASREPVKAPSRWLTALEARAVAERQSMRLSRPLLERLPRGDGHPVLVLPGFLADDRSTQALRQLLDRLGYATYGWGLGTNLGPTTRITSGLIDVVAQIVSEQQRRFSIVGWSLGGIFGRAIARESPTMVRQVITLGSPIHMVDGDASAPNRMWAALSHLHDPNFERGIPEIERPPLPVPTTAVYTKSDGIVHWKTCLTETGPTSESVRVVGSHCGLGFNPAVGVVVADRLAQREGRWEPFRAPLYLRTLFPPTSDLDKAALGAPGS